MEKPHIHVLLDGVSLTHSVREALDQIDAVIEITLLDSMPKLGTQQRADARLLLTADGKTLTGGKLRMLQRWNDSDPCPTLVLSTEADGEVPPAIDVDFNCTVDFVGPQSEQMLAGRLLAMCALRGAMDNLRREIQRIDCDRAFIADRLRRRDDDMAAAASMQRDLMPNEPVCVRDADVSILSHPIDQVSGDIHSLRRVDDSTVAIAMADATGHGMAAALLAGFIDRALSGRDDHQGAERSPQAVMARLNRQIIDAELPDCQFVSALYGTYDEETRVLRLARGGAPYPIVINVDGRTSELPSGGPLLGIDASAHFEDVSVKLEPGDTVLMFSDGLESLMGRYERDDSRWRDWLDGFRSNTLEEQLTAARKLADEFDPNEPQADDITVFVLRVRATVPPNQSDRIPQTLASSSAEASVSRSFPHRVGHASRAFKARPPSVRAC